MLEERLHGSEAGVGQRASNPLSCVLHLVEMILVVRPLELVVIRLYLSLRGSAQKSIALSEKYMRSGQSILRQWMN